MAESYCQSKGSACVACCGILNAGGSDEERRQYLSENRRRFMTLDIKEAANLVEYRRIREREDRINPEVYICPFLGWLESEESRAGCMLHPEGSPHPDIGHWQHPQNFSFYGEGICLAYDCLSKENDMRADFAPSADVLLNSRLTAHHNLLKTAVEITKRFRVDKNKLRAELLKYLEETELPVTSFEEPLNPKDYSDEELWVLLGTLLDPDGFRPPLQLSEKGRKKGRAIKHKILTA